MPASGDELNRSPKQISPPDWELVVFEARHAPGFSGTLNDSYARFHFAIAG